MIPDALSLLTPSTWPTRSGSGAGQLLRRLEAVLVEQLGRDVADAGNGHQRRTRVPRLLLGLRLARTSRRQPVRRDARRTFCPFLPIASES